MPISPTTNATIVLLLPEIVLVLFATAIYLGGALTRSRDGWSWMAAAALLLAATALLQQHDTIHLAAAAISSSGAHGAFTGPLVVDLFGQTLRWLILGVGLALVMISSRTAARKLAAEFMGSLLLIVAGLMLVAQANDLVILFLGLELVSIPTYVVLYLGRGDAPALEAATKYFFLSILSSALLLYGFSFLYGASGSTSLLETYRVLAAAPARSVGALTFAGLAMVLVFAGLGFRITAVPFHFYAPDVFQGTTNPNAGLLAVVPKVAGFVALVRLLVVAMPGMEKMGWQLSLVFAMLTMTVGNLLALWQHNVRRLLAYSSIAHAGYMLIGLAVSFAVAGGATSSANLDGVGATMFYLLVYALATTGAFAALTYLGSEHRQIDGVDELAGLGRSHPKTAACMAIFMFSLTGLPPLAGFWGKLTLLAGALGVDAAGSQTATSGLWPWFVALAVVGVVNAAISAAYYLRIVGVMYFRSSLSIPTAQGGVGAALAGFACAALVVLAGLSPGPLVTRANAASRAARETLKLAVEESAAAPQAPGEPDRATAAD